MTEDRTFTRWFHIDLRALRIIRGRIPLTGNGRPQSIALFHSCDEDAETFAISQTMPRVQGDDMIAPSQLQYGAVVDFFSEGCESRLEASVLLSARDYADQSALNMHFTADRRRLIATACAAFILQDVEMRLKVRGLNMRRRGSGVRTGDLPRIQEAVETFAGQVVEDARRSGSRAFT
ncbi:MAG: hypothetical protein VYB32_08065 [Pseudomonadota bacterium]|nr:hypothetical protein [Pseudomonadota bacterium]